MDDLISRAQAIDAVKDGMCMFYNCDVIEKLEALPSVQSEPCEDTISRQAAIDELKRISFSHWFECGEYLSEDTREIKIISSSKALEAIEALPPAQPERCEDCENFSKTRLLIPQPEIVRCKDCIKREICRTSTTWAVAPKDDWYCADAERKTDG